MTTYVPESAGSDRQAASSCALTVVALSGESVSAPSTPEAPIRDMASVAGPHCDGEGPPESLEHAATRQHSVPASQGLRRVIPSMEKGSERDRNAGETMCTRYRCRATPARQHALGMGRVFPMGYY